MFEQGHHGEIWALAVSPNGKYVTSSSHDKSLRVWERSEEPLIVDEEREMEREAEAEASVEGGGAAVIAGESKGEAGMAGKKTIETVKAVSGKPQQSFMFSSDNLVLEVDSGTCRRRVEFLLKECFVT